MKWYGAPSYSLQTLIIKKKQRFKKKLKMNSLLLSNRINMGSHVIKFYVPTNWNFLIVKTDKNFEILKIFLFSTTYFFVMPFLQTFSRVYYEKQSGVIAFSFHFKNNYFQLFWTYFKPLFYGFSKIFYKKLKFKGKGYYIYKNSRNTIALQFGYSHLIHLYSFLINVKFLTKTIILMFGINNKNVFNRAHALFKLKPINIFTGKGIRFSRQILYKKTGKISSYR